MYRKLAAAILLSTATSTAQETRGMIFGHVHDATSSAITGAKVVVKNADTNVSTDVVTNTSGYYEAPLLVSGTYQVNVEAPGFKKAERSKFPLPIATRLEVEGDQAKKKFLVRHFVLGQLMGVTLCNKDPEKIEAAKTELRGWPRGKKAAVEEQS